VALGLLKTILAILILSQRGHSWDSLPFINPLLWLDWLAIYGVSGYIWPGFSFISLIMTILSYPVGFWLTIGYGTRGYGVRQYDVLDIPDFCKNAAISFQTDPRRHHFVALHVVLFAFGTISLIILSLYIFNSGERGIDEEEIPGDVKFWIVIFLILPTFIGMCIAAAQNSHPYLILGQRSCYASYVSGQRAYVDVPDVSWTVKLATVIGLNI
jgi:hypothetical protein